MGESEEDKKRKLQEEEKKRILVEVQLAAQREALRRAQEIAEANKGQGSDKGKPKD
jgi:hypothetical protein